jgi:hypothetical protein
MFVYLRICIHDIFFSQKQEEKIKVKNIFCATTENQTGNCKTLRQGKKTKEKTV